MADRYIFDRKLLTLRRARASGGAENHDFLLRHAAEELMSRLDTVKREFRVVLNLGASHSIASAFYARKLSGALLVSSDPCLPLLKRCPGLKVAADEEVLPFGDGRLDLVLSVLALHFVNDLPGTFVQIRRALKPDGLFLGALLGGDTLRELREAFLAADIEMTGGASPRVMPVADVRDYGALLQRAGFGLPVADSERLTVTYPDVLALLQDLRRMGAANILVERSRKPLRRSVLARMSAIYHERFGLSGGRIPATFEIIYLTGWAPHESQQKPLTPGSAKVRLADALGVKEHSAGDKAAFPKKT